jgi:hypothetical protein
MAFLSLSSRAELKALSACMGKVAYNLNHLLEEDTKLDTNKSNVTSSPPLSTHVPVFFILLPDKVVGLNFDTF